MPTLRFHVAVSSLRKVHRENLNYGITGRYTAVTTKVVPTMPIDSDSLLLLDLGSRYFSKKERN